MQRFLVVLLVVSACSDDDRNKTVPDTELVEVPPELTNETHVRILFEARGNANAFVCTLDGQTSTCISPFEADVTDGEHTFTVAASLNANVDETPAMHVWRVDSVAPDTTITSAPPTLDNATMPSVAFASDDDGATFECAVDGGAFGTCASPLPLNLADGPHAFAVRAKDAAGNVDPSPAEHGWTIDSTAPDTEILTGPAANATTGRSGSFTFDSPDATATFECSLDSAAFAACTSPFAFSALAGGAHTFAVRAKDPGGIVDPSPAMRAWTVDATGPVVTITSTPTNPSNVTSPAFAFTANETATFECQIDGVVTFTACTAPWTTPTAVTDGNRTFRVRGTDTFGNVGAAATFAWVVDTAPPSVSFTGLPAALSNDTTPTATFNTAGAPTVIECRVDGGAFAACTSPFTAGAQLDGMHTITVRVTDAAGNQGSATTPMFEIDTVAPTATIQTQPAALSNDTTPTVTFTTAGAPTSTRCRLNNGSLSSCSGTFTTTATQGTHTISIVVADGAGNQSTTTTNMFTIDTTPPTVTITTAPASLSNDNTPAVAFTHTGVSAQCRVDNGTLVACTSPHTFGTTLDGAHTITVVATDGAGNQGSATTSTFTIDTVGPSLAFTDQPPAAWPVNYYDFTFTTGDSTTIACSLDNGAFQPCTSPHTTTVTYGVAHTLRVRGTDAAGNNTTITSGPWTPNAGLVLHYPWEQGGTDNTSLLKQRAAYSPSGGADLPFVGGWAGSAAGSIVSAHTYAGTRRVLQSSADGAYTVTFWLRASPQASTSTILSTLNGTEGGLRVVLGSSPAAGLQLVVQVAENGQSPNPISSPIPTNRWVHVALRTTGTAKGLELFVDGLSRGTIATINGFSAGQANLTVGPTSQVDVDDLRFYNVAFTNSEVCTTLARGMQVVGGPCITLAPGFEIDFENNTVADTGTWGLLLVGPQERAFVSHTLGNLLRMASSSTWGYSTANGPTFSSQVASAPGRSFTFSFVAGGATGRLIDFTRSCSPTGSQPVCGIAVHYVNGQLEVYTGTPLQQKTTVIGSADGLVAGRFNNVVVTEQRGANSTVSLTVYVNMVKTSISISGGHIYERVNDNVLLAATNGMFVDEYEFWPFDLSAGLEMLCENGADGEFDVVTNSCLLTAGP